MDDSTNKTTSFTKANVKKKADKATQQKADSLDSGAVDDAAAVAASILELSKPQQLSSAIVRQRLQEAMSLLPKDSREAYDKAAALTPRLVDEESDPEAYMRFTNYDSTLAAKRLTMYWKKRNEVFGHRAYLPLDLTGNGALDADDVSLFATGIAVILPKPSKNGNPILCWSRKQQHDLENWTDDVTVSGSRRRVMFFVLQCLSKHENASTKGIAVIWRLPISEDKCEVGTSSRFVQTAASLGLEMIYTAFPIRLARVDTVYLESKESYKNTFMFWVLPIILRQVSKYVAEIVLIHRKINSSFFDAVGIDAKSLPDYYSGGEYMISRDLYMWGKKYGMVNKKLLSVSNRRKMSVSIHPAFYSFIREFPETMHEVIHMTPQDQLEHILEAYCSSPSMFRQETDVRWFLRLDSNEARDALRRLEKYWEIRKLVYKDRAYLPLDLSEYGALPESDINLLRTQFFALLPDDEQGCPVVLSNYCNVPKETTFESSLCCFFYMCFEVAKREVAQDKGIRLVYYADSVRLTLIHDFLGCIDVVEKSLPLKLHSVVIVVVSDTPSSLLSSFNINLKHSVNIALQERTTVIHAATVDKVYAQLRTHLFRSTGLPEDLGGSWKYIDWNSQLANKIRMDRDCQLYPLIKLAPDSSSSPTLYRAEQHQHQQQQLQDQSRPTKKDESDQDLNKRKMGIIYSRRKRSRQRMRTEALHKQVSEAKASNEKLKVDHEKLKEYLAKAEAEVKRYQGQGMLELSSSRRKPSPKSRKRGASSLQQQEHSSVPQNSRASLDSMPPELQQHIQSNSASNQPLSNVVDMRALRSGVASVPNIGGRSAFDRFHSVHLGLPNITNMAAAAAASLRYPGGVNFLQYPDLANLAVSQNLQNNDLANLAVSQNLQNNDLANLVAPGAAMHPQNSLASISALHGRQRELANYQHIIDSRFLSAVQLPGGALAPPNLLTGGASNNHISAQGSVNLQQTSVNNNELNEEGKSDANMNESQVKAFLESLRGPRP